MDVRSLTVANERKVRVRLFKRRCVNLMDGAIGREKEVKGWVRRKKIAVIVGVNSLWEDLYPAFVK
jgi:predicted GIY-YIG superfamily endonuclease